MEKKCTKCEKVKSLDEFCNDKSKKDGKFLKCRKCASQYYKDYRKNNKEKEKLRHHLYHKKNKEKINQYTKEYRKDNQEQLAEYRDNYRKNNKEKEKLRHHLYYLNNKEKIKTYKEKWNKNNPKKLKNYSLNSYEYRLKYHKERRENDSLFKLRGNISGIIRNSLRNNGYNKKTKTYSILKCEFNFFINWLNSKASNGYTYGTGNLNLDHVIPISLAQTEEESYLLNHYSNFQLLSADENQSKGNRYVNPVNLARVLEHHPNPDKIKEIHARL